MFRRPVGHAEEGEEVRTEGGWEKELSKASSPGRWVREGRLGTGAGKASSPGRWVREAVQEHALGLLFSFPTPHP